MHNLTPEEYDAYIRAKLMEDAEEIALSENFEKGKAAEKKDIEPLLRSLSLYDEELAGSLRSSHCR